MDPIHLSCTLADGIPLRASFDVDKGMNLSSFRLGEKELIHNQQGFLIGPHFGQRNPHMYPGKESDPLPNGISRQAPWKAELKDDTLVAMIDGKEVWNEKPLAEQEGQGFKQRMTAKLTPEGLHITLSVVSDTDSMIGIDYGWTIPDDNSTLTASVGPYLLAGTDRQPTENFFPRNHHNEIEIALQKLQGDFTFYLSPNPVKGHIRLQGADNSVQIIYSCICQENCWRLVRNADTNFVRVQALSAQNPFSPNLTVSSLSIIIAPL